MCIMHGEHVSRGVAKPVTSTSGCWVSAMTSARGSSSQGGRCWLGLSQGQHQHKPALCGSCFHEEEKLGVVDQPQVLAQYPKDLLKHLSLCSPKGEAVQTLLGALWVKSVLYFPLCPLEMWRLYVSIPET